MEEPDLPTLVAELRARLNQLEQTLQAVESLVRQGRGEATRTHLHHLQRKVDHFHGTVQRTVQHFG